MVFWRPKALNRLFSRKKSTSPVTMAPHAHHAHLHRLKIIHNPNYKPSGTKSYVSLLKKYRFTPTLDGPYVVGNFAHHQGKHGHQHTIGGKTTMHHAIKKKKHHKAGSSTAATPGDDEVGDVPAEDSQNDSEYLCQVEIGTPAKTFTLDFDTGSADLWVMLTLSTALLFDCC